MSRSFAGIQSLPYRGTPYSMPILICDKPTMPPAMVRVDLDWNVYWQAVGNPGSVGVNVNLNNLATTAKVLDRIVSVKVDNIGSNNSIYIQFPDTFDVIACPPNTAIIVPVQTNVQECTIFATGLLAGSIPMTRIYFANVVLQSVVDPEIDQAIALYKGSPVIQRTNSLLPGYGTPALGDQSVSGFLSNFNDNLPQSAIILPAAASGFYYVTALTLQCVYAFIRWNESVGFNHSRFNCSLRDLTSGVDIFEFKVDMFAAEDEDVAYRQTFNIIEQNGFNFRLDATHNYGIRVLDITDYAGSSGVDDYELLLSCIFFYTLNPE